MWKLSTFPLRKTLYKFVCHIHVRTCSLCMVVHVVYQRPLETSDSRLVTACLLYRYIPSLHRDPGEEKKQGENVLFFLSPFFQTNIFSYDRITFFLTVFPRGNCEFVQNGCRLFLWQNFFFLSLSFLPFATLQIVSTKAAAALTPQTTVTTIAIELSSFASLSLSICCLPKGDNEAEREEESRKKLTSRDSFSNSRKIGNCLLLTQEYMRTSETTQKTLRPSYRKVWQVDRER